MDIKPQNSQPISDDQELAKVLAGVDGDDKGEAADASEAMSNVTPPTTPGVPPVAPLSPADVSTTLPDGSTSPVIPGSEDSAKDAEEPAEAAALPPLPPAPEMTPPADSPALPTPTSDLSAAIAPTGELDNIKKEALGELRPLVDKLNLDPDEKFDTYLLLIRSTDDKTLVGPAHEAAKNIPDETKRAQALLDIIKEIDFLSQQQ